MSANRPPTMDHIRTARQWPFLRTEPVTLPYPTPRTPPPATTLYITAASIVGAALSVLFLGSTGGSGAGLGIGLLALSGTTGLASIGSFLWQRRTTAADNNDILRQYTARLDALAGPDGSSDQGEVPGYLQAEADFRRANDLPLVRPDSAPSPRDTLIQRVQYDTTLLWQRGPHDPDFLSVRIGSGSARPRFAVRLPEQADAIAPRPRHSGFITQHERVRKLVALGEWLPSVPITIPLRDHSSVALYAGSSGLRSVYELANSLIGEIALLHSPHDVHIVVLSSQPPMNQWGWVMGLSSGKHAGDALPPELITGDATRYKDALDMLRAELGRREQRFLSSSAAHQTETQPPLPHLVLVVDAVQPSGGQRQPNLHNPAIQLALRNGKALGATVVSLHAAQSDVPEHCTLAVDVGAAKVIPLWPDPPPAIQCDRIDSATAAECMQVTQVVSRYQPQDTAEVPLATEVNLLTLFAPPIHVPHTYDIKAVWNQSRQLAAQRAKDEPTACSVPIGIAAGGQTQWLDFVRDGPHGLLIGQTGSGKSELLRSIIAALAIRYPPDMVKFVLVDYKGGLGLDIFEGLPHTLTLLTNLAQAGQTNRFLTMLESEVLDRQEKVKNHILVPRLFVLIDEFAEMVMRRGPNDNSDAILDNLLRILRLGRQLSIHLLFASQRPEGSVIAKLRGYVQYSIALRTGTEDDSRAVVGRPDAAQIPVKQPGRGYVLLPNDNALTLFQSALISLPVATAPRKPGEDPPTADFVIAERMKKEAGGLPVERWPKSLPTSTVNRPTPLILMISGGLKPVEDAWNARTRDPKPMYMQIPLGKYDRPSKREQEWFNADLYGHGGKLHGGPLLVMGDFNSGKTTTLQTVLLHCVLTYKPEDLRCYLLDPSGSFEVFAGLPHFRDDEGKPTIAEGDENSFRDLKARFEGELAANRRHALLLVIDDYDELASSYSTQVKSQLHQVAQLVAKSRNLNAFLAVSTARQTLDLFPTVVFNAMATKVILYMSSREALAQALGGRAPYIPDPLPGRGFAQTRTNLDEIQIAAPVFGANEAELLANLQQELLRLTRP